MKDKKLADIIQKGEEGQVVLLGFPHDRGVEINGGRVGAKEGPARFREILNNFGAVDNPEFEQSLSTLSITDAGDILPEGPLEKAHTVLTEKVGAILAKGGIPFVVGGGNDQSYANASALLNHKPEEPIGVINIDAHLDVRPLKDGKAHSGSPFRQLLEDNRFSGENFFEFATQGGQCSREHTDYVRSKKGTILWLNEMVSSNNTVSQFRGLLGNLAWCCPRIFVSFDMDSVASSEAPGVSCPAILGLTAHDALSIAHLAGSHPQVDLFDLSEYNPVIEKDRTGKLAVGIFYYFCFGVVSRRKTS